MLKLEKEYLKLREYAQSRESMLKYEKKVLKVEKVSKN